MEQGMLEEVYQDIIDFTKICKQSRDFTLMLKNPVIRNDKKRQILKELFFNRVNKVTYAFFEIMIRKNRGKYLPETAVAFKHQYNAVHEIGMAKVTTVFPLDEDLRNEFKRLIKSFTGKRQIELEEVTNKDLVGGFVLNLGDRQMDESLKGKLNELKLKFS